LITILSISILSKELCKTEQTLKEALKKGLHSVFIAESLEIE